MGPIAAALYIVSDKEPAPGTHEEFIRPLWKQAMGSTIHCVAGDATGIILAATITAILGFPMWVDLIVEYAAGFAFGLLIFQALFMKDMMGGYMRAMEPSQILYWGVMSLGVTVGFATAYPVNWWLVANGLKHGMGTQRALGRGGHSMEAERERLRALAGEAHT